MMAATILGLVSAYVVVAVLLLSLNLTSRWKWWVKAAAIVVTGIFFIQAYIQTYALLGWPTDTDLPRHFQVLWAKVEDPNKFTGAEGAIFLWVDELDEFNLPIGVPRSHKLPYTPGLADAVVKITGRIRAGMDVAGIAELADDEESTSSRMMKDVTAPEDLTGGQFQVDVFPDQIQTLQFEDMPPPILPDKD
ncbi:MAG: hypothetical protein CMM33_04600 [Rhodospirillaceae bacterium]|jgi:hypothetical protein|nr:hypothetical protein [Rhodospirillaceae bacterium]|tara:strand:- start:68 stop:643 length:576 start_codon:yes stop_codon:yes gene_type:complete